MRRVVSGIMLTIFFVCVLVVAFNIRSVKATRITVPDDYRALLIATLAAPIIQKSKAFTRPKEEDAAN